MSSQNVHSIQIEPFYAVCYEKQSENRRLFKDMKDAARKQARLAFKSNGKPAEWHEEVVVNAKTDTLEFRYHPKWLQSADH